MFDWTFHAGDILIAGGLIISWLVYRSGEARKHEENVSRLARIEADLHTLMEFYKHWIADFFKREP